MNADEILARLAETSELRRRDDLEEFRGRLTRREWSLVREAAVMGWVQGIRHHDMEMPKDQVVMDTVVLAALANGDLYPILSGRADQYASE